MATIFTYRAGDELPGLTLPWQQETAAGTWTDLDLSSGYTFTLALIDSTGTSSSPSSTVTGYNGGVTVAWSAGALAITAGRYKLIVTAREAATSKDRTYNRSDPPIIEILD